jgi:hypothetical protein
MKNIWSKWKIPVELKELLNNKKDISFPKSRAEILDMTMGTKDNLFYEVAYDVPSKGRIVEATVTRCKNGFAVNYTEEYMRRRDPDCLVIGDDEETDKTHFSHLFNCSFEDVRAATFSWLVNQPLCIITIMIGGTETGYKGLLVAPDNTGFFMGGLADLQGFIPPEEIPEDLEPEAIIYLAPPFRHTYFKGKQIVAHNRIGKTHEIFSYNLYPGPSAKKGIYGVLLQIGEREKWLTLHASTVQAVTPYDNITTILHEGASGGGKSEMLEYPHREEDGRLLLGKNQITGEKFYFSLTQSCKLRPVTDDMALSLPSFKTDEKKLVVYDAENAWFIRLNHITNYGTDPHLERLCIHPSEPLIFMNLDGKKESTCLIWEHTEDAPGKPCPNPRVIFPRNMVPNVVNEPVEVDFRSFGIRTPISSAENPSYGIIGMLHILPPALAWLWRLVAPRGASNPSIIGTDELSSEGVGSFWPFATGKYINHANHLLRQIVDTPKTRYILFPNQHIGVWKVSFMPQWICREWIARRGQAKFRQEQLDVARSSLLGYLPNMLMVDGVRIMKMFLEVNKQPEVGDIGYDKGEEILFNFFKKELSKYNCSEIDTLGKKIIECCFDRGTVDDYNRLIPMTY